MIYIKQGDYRSSWSGCLVQVPGQPAKLFSFARFRKRVALELAIAHRDRLMKAAGLPRPRQSGQCGEIGLWVKHHADRRSGTGIVGVHIQKQRIRRKRNGRVCSYTIETALAECSMGSVDGRAQVARRQFSVRRYGLAKALELAERARDEFVKRKLKRLFK